MFEGEGVFVVCSVLNTQLPFEVFIIIVVGCGLNIDSVYNVTPVKERKNLKKGILLLTNLRRVG